MRVMLINPPIDCVLENGHVSPVTSYLFYNSAPLGLLYIAAEPLPSPPSLVPCVLRAMAFAAMARS